jgi:hypothetical protein
MQLLDRQSTLWDYLSPEVRGLLEDGERVLAFVEEYRIKGEITDFSFLVFPFSKAYEGFLKRFLFDTGLIREEDYYSDDIRIGRILNPYYVKEKSNVFNKLCDKSKEGKEVPKKLWSIWKRGRNLVFHYFPHNFRRLEYQEAVEIIEEIISAMNSAVVHCRV